MLVRFGMQFSWDSGSRRIICELDALMVLHLIQTADTQFHPLGAFIEDVRELKSRNWDCVFMHTLREGHYCADALSKMGCELEDDFVIFRDPPAGLVDLLRADAWGLVYPRGGVVLF